jgi:hypothetical protein
MLAFRRIRLKFVSKRNVTRYLAYAIGEIVLIVVGILLAVQLSDWNDLRKSKDLEWSYLNRLAADIRTNVARFSEYRETELTASQATTRFSMALGDDSSSDADIVDAARVFFTVGWVSPNFEATITTFNDLEATGNLQIIRNNELREEIIGLHTGYAQFQGSLAINQEWMVPLDSRLTYEYDALRWDERTSALFLPQTTKESANEIRSRAEVLIRLAAVHFWIQDRVLEQYEDAIALSSFVADKIDAELNRH